MRSVDQSVSQPQLAGWKLGTTNAGGKGTMGFVTLPLSGARRISRTFIGAVAKGPAERVTVWRPLASVSVARVEVR